MRRSQGRYFRELNPYVTANCISRLTFWYSLHYFRKGAGGQEVTEEDLMRPLAEHKSSYLGDKLSEVWTKEVQRCHGKRRQPSFQRALNACFGKELILYGFLAVFYEVGVRIHQPMFIGLLLRYFDPRNDEKATTNEYSKYIGRLLSYFSSTKEKILYEEAVLYLFGIITCSAVVFFMMHPVLMAVGHVGMKMRIATSSLIYRKALRLSLGALGGQTVGNIMNIMANDVNRFDNVTMFTPYIFIGPVQLLFTLYFVYRAVGIASLWGFAVVCLAISIQVMLGQCTRIKRRNTARKTDERVFLTNEIIQAIQVIKMYAWENAFERLIHKVRMSELLALMQNSYIKGTIMSFIMFTSRFAVFVTCFAALELDHVLSIEEVFFIVGYYQILRHTMTVNFPQGIANLAEFQVAVERIRTFLLLPESNVGDPTPYCPNWKETPMYANFQKQELLYDDDQRLELENVTVRIDGKDVLHEVNACVQPGKLTMIVGEVGSGKSCMLHAMMCEMDPVRGRIYKQGILSYASQEPWLFAGSVKQNIIFGHEFDRTRYQEVINLCALTRDLTLLPYGDSTVVGERGISLSGGQRARVNLARAIYKEADIYLLDDPLSAVDPSVSRHLFEKLITGYLKNKIVVLATHQLQFLKSAPQIIVMKGGRVEMVGTFADFQNSGMDFVKFADQKAPEESSIDHATAEIVHSISKKDIAKDHVNGPDSAERIMGPVMPGYKLYLGYFGAGGNVLLIFLVIFLFALSQVFISGADFFMNEWIQSEERVMLLKTAATSNYEQFCDDYCIYMFSGSIGLLTVVSLSRSYYFYYFCLRASRTLHRKMFLCIVRTRMWFFNVNPSGRILNRFSKDLGTVDEFLPNSFLDFVQLFLNMVGTVIIFVIVSPWLMIPSIVLTAIFFGIRHYYMKTCRSIKRLEGSTKSPVYSHLNASLQGLATIRMHEMEDILVEEFDKYQDDHSSAFWMFTVTSRAFGYIMDFIVLLYIVLISTYFFLIPSGNKMDAGLCITQCMGLTGLFQWGMRQSTELENLLTSVERVIEYTKLDIEPALKSEKGKEPPPDWPQFGRIVMENLSMNYNVMEPPVLKNLNIVINPKEKIGIVGRTGAGKSSLIGALFRLAYIHGEIYIDDIETGTIGLHDLRRKISIIPQEPILFTGTMRSNLDPFGEYKDEDLFKALLAVELKCALTMGETALDMHMAEGGVNFSVGERQLVCLARAIVRNNRILILDEATANVDPQTDKFIQTTIRKSFAECTVLTVAHRLLTIIDSDRVLVMDAGRCVEFDHPFILMSNSQSFFAQMVDKSGPGNAALYKQMAAVGFTGLQDAEEDDGDGDEDNGEQFQEDD